MPSLPIERGRPGPGLLAHVLVAKYADHTPLYRQSAIYAREGVALDRSTLADWVGRATWLLQPLGERLAANVFAGIKVHADDTPVPVLDPGRGRTKKGRLWVYVRDDRPCADVSPPAAVFFYTPDRKGERPAEHLARFGGFLQADAYAGFDKLYGERIVEVACWAHLRRKIFDVHESTKSQVAADALQKIGELYAIEKAIRGKPPDRRRDVRQEQAKPRLMALRTWFEAQLARLRRRAASPRQSATRSETGPRSSATPTTAAWRSTTTAPKIPCAASPSAGKTGSSPARIAVASAPPSSTA